MCMLLPDLVQCRRYIFGRSFSTLGTKKMYKSIYKLTLIKIDSFLSLLDVYIHNVLQNRFFWTFIKRTNCQPSQVWDFQHMSSEIKSRAETTINSANKKKDLQKINHRKCLIDLICPQQCSTKWVSITPTKGHRRVQQSLCLLYQ